MKFFDTARGTGRMLTWVVCRNLVKNSFVIRGS